MLKYILLILALAQFGCYLSEESGGYKPIVLTSDARQRLEWAKRELLTLEDVQVGYGPVAALGRKIEADIEVRYADGDGKPIYRGPAISYFGMEGYVFIHNGVAENGLLSTQQRGIMLGLNGMAVGGKRRITIHPRLVCEESGVEVANPNVSCTLIRHNRKIKRPIDVRKEKLIVEATLTASCTPVFLEIPFIYYGQFRCRDSDIPKLGPSAEIWRIY